LIGSTLLRPAIAALSGRTRKTCTGRGINTREQLKAALISLSAALGSVTLKALSSLDLTQIKKIVDEVEEERFVRREWQVRLREHFEAIIKAVRGKNLKGIVFFIDDLDRCLPPQILSLLEALKLYLNLEGCVYFLGLDRDPIEQSIRHYYSALNLTEAEYLDKIIQLPFTIPPIAPEGMTSFVEPLLPLDLKSCCQTLVDGLAPNPRQVKRFINTLTLNHLLAAELRIPDYDPSVLALLLIIQLRNRMLYRQLTREPAILTQLNAQGEAADELRKQHLEGDPDLQRILGGRPPRSQPQHGQPQQGEPPQRSPRQGQPQRGWPPRGRPQRGQPQLGRPQRGRPPRRPPRSHPQLGRLQRGRPYDRRWPYPGAARLGRRRPDHQDPLWSDPAGELDAVTADGQGGDVGRQLGRSASSTESSHRGSGGDYRSHAQRPAQSPPVPPQVNPDGTRDV
jgi:hypothetical protein